MCGPRRMPRQGVCRRAGPTGAQGSDSPRASPARTPLDEARAPRVSVDMREGCGALLRL